MELFKLIKEKKEDDFLKLFEGNNINVVDKSSHNLLMNCIFHRSVSIALFLVKRGIDLNYKDKNGQTVLHHLAIYYDREILELILEKGIDIHIQDIYGNHALWSAVFNDKGFGSRVEMIKMLMAKGANPNHKNNVNKTPLEISKIANYVEVQKILLAN